MKIQCPKCRTNYQTRVLVDSHSPLQATCPKCQYRFLVAFNTPDSLKILALPKILIVDDARFFRELLLELLAERQAELLTADTAKGAWERLQQDDVALLIVDINLPDVSGLKLITQIRQHEKLKNIRILCVSGVYRQDDDALKALRAGADDFISKSFKPDELNQRIDKLLNL
ncbi:MAG: response regulator [Deltaproteobacteria bacterium]|nr:response regulator [Deltaproteobacteria bacterium]